MKKLYDKKGREIKEFDVLKIFHFIGPGRKKNYMYKWVRNKNNSLAGLHLCNDSGDSFWLRAIANENGVIEDAEIVQGYGS